jgi:hypothetical protein
VAEGLEGEEEEEARLPKKIRQVIKYYYNISI